MKIEKSSETIFIVDNSVQQKIKSLIEEKYNNIIHFYKIDEIIKLIKLQQPALIILNINSKEYDEISFLKKISTLEIPIILCGVKEISVIKNAYKLGVVDVIKEPFLKEELYFKIDLWIDNRKKQKESNHSSLLLQEYKDAVDESSIVSKTNNKGIITYVNEQFCLLSGYKKEELIGKNHNIVRHPDTPKKVFEEIWNTIKNKKIAWKGKIKNKKKDGSYYWVEAFIKPIIDKNGNIEEFIALRNDITEQEEAKEYFKLKLKGSEDNLNHSIKLAKEYEKAIDISSILLRTNNFGEIIYVNDKFIELTQFSREELIGSDYKIFKHKDIKDSLFENLELLIDDKKIFNKILNNKSKNGDNYWINITIVQIKDDNNFTIEYMWIINDLTELFNLNEEIQSTQKEIIYKMGEIGETRSKETGNHVKRVAEYSKLLAILYGISENEANNLLIASPMHDIGKVGIPDSILKKPGKLTPDEFDFMKEHSIIGYNILKDSNRDILKTAAIVAKEHHERYDGTGYPFGLKGEEIHIYGRITAIADVFDALGSDRCYKKAWKDEEIFELLENEKGKQFDPFLVSLFLENKNLFIEIRNRYKD
ncbi:PAS domain S-box protein [Arcobacter ellisii]|uniref:Regulator n=1 Tax=Arcobacter ellisii TaxID=913109 RepID=A0A347U8S9_9BACT|nr:PAS domain S-box protein [Arcobacter ellisii]AXX95257.1 multi-sensor domain-containing two-component system response regulator c-di-GMP phosphodiesterase, RpfG family [Arcobacter ellisii]RXI30093.1 regulator [Arcobacter ellisii]